jgi:hypothetical protein
MSPRWFPFPGRQTFILEKDARTGDARFPWIHCILALDANSEVPSVRFAQDFEDTDFESVVDGPGPPLLLYDDEDRRIAAVLASLPTSPLPGRAGNIDNDGRSLRAVDDGPAADQLATLLLARTLVVVHGGLQLLQTERFRDFLLALPERSPVLAGELPARMHVALVEVAHPALALRPVHLVIEGIVARDWNAFRASLSARGFPVRTLRRENLVARMAADRAALFVVESGRDEALEISCRGGARGAAAFAKSYFEETEALVAGTTPRRLHDLADALAAVDASPPALAVLRAAPRPLDLLVAADTGRLFPSKSLFILDNAIPGFLPT